MWTPFGSTYCHGKSKNPHWPEATVGSSCQRNGVVYHWGFDAATGQAGCIVKVDGIRVR